MLMTAGRSSNLIVPCACGMNKRLDELSPGQQLLSVVVGQGENTKRLSIVSHKGRWCVYWLTENGRWWRRSSTRRRAIMYKRWIAVQKLIQLQSEWSSTSIDPLYVNHGRFKDIPGDMEREKKPETGGLVLWYIRWMDCVEWLSIRN